MLDVADVEFFSELILFALNTSKLRAISRILLKFQLNKYVENRFYIFSVLLRAANYKHLLRIDVYVVA